MSGPTRYRKNINEGKPSLEKYPQINDSNNKKIEPNLKSSSSFSQILNQNNSMFLEIDFDSIDKSDCKKRKSEPNELHNLQPNFFAIPKLVKKSRITSNRKDLVDISSSSPKKELLNCSTLNNSQRFLQTIENEENILTQVNCIEDIEDNENLISIITNPVTCSQYLQNKNEKQQANTEIIQTENVNQMRKHSDILAGDNYSLDSFNDFDEELIRQAIEAENYNKKPTESKELMTENGHKKQPNTCVGISQHQRNPISSEHRSKILPVSSSSFRELGPFFGLPRHFQTFIMKTKNIDGLYDWQEECLGLRAIHDKTNLVYALPTSGGKTLVAEIAMFREVLLRKKNVIFVLPYVSIVQEKFHDLLPFAVEFRFNVEEYCAGKGSIPPARRRKKNTIYVCTIEKSQILFDSLHKTGRLKEIGMIVVDELHMVGDSQRGFVLETLLMKAVFHKEFRIQVIGMSATIANLREVASFLNADIYTRNFRPIELKEYVKIGSDIFIIDGEKKFISEAFTYERSVGDDYKSKMLKRDPDHVAALVLEIVPHASCLIFCPTKQNCENVAVMLGDLFPRELRDEKTDEKLSLIENIRADSNGRICPVLAKTILFGIAYHHSGLTSDERKHLEEAFRLSIINVLCCTSTLAAGVNLPAQRVVIRSPYIGSQFLTLSRYKQMVGRAGRAGKCETGESFMICDPKDHQKLTNLLCSTMDETISGFLQDESGKRVKTVVLNILAMKLATSVDDIVEFFKCSLLCVQISRIEKSLRQVIVESIKELTEQGALSYTNITVGNRYPSFKINDKDEVYPDNRLNVSKLGLAAVNAGISLEEAQTLEKDLINAHENLVLSQSLHLLYIVSPQDIVDAINPDIKHFNNIIMRLEKSLLHTANIVGITESLAMKMITRPTLIKESEKLLMKRFYVALMLFDLWNGENIHEVASRYKVNRGIAFNLMSSAASRAYCIYRFCEIYDDFWVFKEILEKFSKRLSYCCSADLLPLMELPTVKIGRAKLLFAAGFRTVEEIAAVNEIDLVQSVKNVNLRQAKHIIKAAKYLMIEKIEECQERLEDMKSAVKQKPFKSDR